MNFPQLMKKFTKWLDPKLEPFREPKQETTKVPSTEKELIDLIKQIPPKVLSKKNKNKVAAIMSFPIRQVGDLMVRKDEMTFVKENETLGPLTLDKLYRSGFSHFPVVDKKGKVVGIIHTEALNSLEVKEAKKAKDLLTDKRIVYVKPSDSLATIVDEFLRTNTLFYVVVDEKENLVGMLTFEILIYYLLGEI